MGSNKLDGPQDLLGMHVRIVPSKLLKKKCKNRNLFSNQFIPTILSFIQKSKTIYSSFTMHYVSSFVRHFTAPNFSLRCQENVNSEFF